MSRVIDLTGQKFGKLTVIKRVENNKDGRAQWLCKCDCGNTKIALGKTLRNGKTTTCGCYYSLIGKRFGKLIVRESTLLRDKQGSIIYQCECDCGNKCLVSARCLTGNNTHSCGCLRSIGENIIEQILKKNNINYIREYTRDEWRFLDTNYLGKFDFYLPDYNRLIEFDGIYHYEDVKNREWNLIKYQEHDKIKNNWAIENKIDLIRIPYWKRDNITLNMLLQNEYLIN